MQSYLAHTNGCVHLAEILVAAGKHQSDLPTLPKYIHPTGQPFLCWTSVLGRCTYRDWRFRKESGHPLPADTDKFVNQITEVIGKGVVKPAAHTGGFWYIAVDTLSTIGSLFLGSLSGYEPFLRFCVLGVGSDPRAASPSAWRRCTCYPQQSAGGRRPSCHLLICPLEKAIKIVPLARLMVQAYYFFFYDRNNTKMRHFNNLPWDDGSRRSPQCPPSHLSMASPSHPAQASARMAQPSGPSTHATSIWEKSPHYYINRGA